VLTFKSTQPWKKPHFLAYCVACVFTPDEA